LGWTQGKVGGLIERSANAVTSNRHQNKYEKRGAFFRAKICGVESPHLPRKTPRFDHQKTTFSPPNFPKPPPKTQQNIKNRSEVRSKKNPQKHPTETAKIRHQGTVRRRTPQRRNTAVLIRTTARGGRRH
jgi:hypothetical protein